MRSFTFNPVEAIDETSIAKMIRSWWSRTQQVIERCWWLRYTRYLNLTMGATQRKGISCSGSLTL